MQTSEGHLASQDLLWLLGSLSNLYRLPFDPPLIEQEYPPPHNLATLHQAARALGFKTGHSSHPANWQKLPLPAIAFLRATPETAADSDSAVDVKNLPVLILKTDGHKLLYFRAGSQAPETITADEAKRQFAPELILVAREAQGKDEAIPGFETEAKSFGFTWFIPELLKHKSIWRDVLLASLAIQLVGLATPLFTQVIIDKVVVHQTHSTLVVLGVALFMFMLFTSDMSWLRQYLVLHTGNRIDAVLGSQVFGLGKQGVHRTIHRRKRPVRWCLLTAPVSGLPLREADTTRLQAGERTQCLRVGARRLASCMVKSC